MAQNSLYYHLKPYLPWRLRMAMRRMVARSRRKSHRSVWPINEAAGPKPEGWPGWPKNRNFALVLTHDVEGVRGLANCRPLMELEKELGFRSSFNFIPEGDYAVPRELREELAAEGFEVGIHDLRHDGKLYWSREEFSDNAKQINRYLTQWGAAGFRSGFMHHNLNWLLDLDIQYDMSTFDTDPFEPQPDGVNTVFPFWVGGPNGNGYVELPYTLPQDFTLFAVLRERGPGIWKTKLDWLAAHGGMALLNVHPDYVDFGEQSRNGSTYPVDWYREFLEYIAGKYHGLIWNALPREVAAWYRSTPACARVTNGATHPAAGPEAHVQNPPGAEGGRLTDLVQGLNGKAIGAHLAKRPAPRRVCMISHSIYESDNRVMRYANALSERGDVVDVVALKRETTQSRAETINGVRVHRLLTRSRKQQSGKFSYLLPLIKFFLLSSAWLSWKHVRHRYDTVHVHNVPDFLVFAAWLPKLTGARIILDIHDLVPEFYASKFRTRRETATVKLLERLERRSAGFANHVIVSNHLWHKVFIARSAPAQKCSVLVNQVDPKVFYLRPRTRTDGRLIVIFPGGLQWHQGLDIAIRAFVRVAVELPQAEFHIYGEGNMKEEWIALTQKLNLTDKVRFFGALPVTRIAEAMANADVGVVPKRADSFGNEAYSTKITEFMALGIPVVVSSTKIDRHYFNDSIVRFFESGNQDALAEALVAILRDGEKRRSMTALATEHIRVNNWEIGKLDYYKLVDELCHE